MGVFRQIGKFYAADKALYPTQPFQADAAVDLKCPKDLSLYPGETVSVDTQVQIAVPPGNVGVIVGKYGLACKGVDVLSGLISYGYTGNVNIVLTNTNYYSFLGSILSWVLGFSKIVWWKYPIHVLKLPLYPILGWKDSKVTFKKGDGIAQLMILSLIQTEWVYSEDLIKRPELSNGRNARIGSK